MKLTPKQEKFVCCLVKGMTGSQAYKESYKTNCSSAVCAVRACELRKKPQIRKRFEELLQRAETEACLSLSEKREILAKIARGETKNESDTISNSISKREEIKASDIIKAIELDNRIDPNYIQMQKELNSNGDQAEDPLLLRYFEETDHELETYSER